MKIRFFAAKFKSLAFVLIVFVTASASFAQNSPWSQNTSPLPAPTGAVNDFAGVIDAATKQQLEAKLKKLKETTNPQVELAVAVVKTTGGREIFDYSLAVARGWGIGSKEDDNPSALLLIAIDDRKYYTQVSKDLEDELPDGVVGSLQRQFLVPEFKKGNYGKGISDTVDAYISTIESYQTGGTAPKAAAPVDERGTGDSLYSVFCCLAILLVLGIIIYSNLRKPNKNDKDRWGGGGFGGGGGVLPWIILGGSGGSSGSSSSDSSWGGSSGGGSDWGGFGGGGDFGGGGAGGDW
jgi:uncharacterized protein